MRHVFTDGIAWSVGWSVYWSVTIMTSMKTAEPIEMPFWLWTREGAILRGVWLIEKHCKAKHFGGWVKGRAVQECVH